MTTAGFNFPNHSRASEVSGNPRKYSEIRKPSPDRKSGFDNLCENPQFAFRKLRKFREISGRWLQRRSLFPAGRIFLLLAELCIFLRVMEP